MNRVILMSNQERGRDKWTVHDPVREVTKHFESKTIAEDKAEHASTELYMYVQVYPPGELPGDDEPEKTLEERWVERQLNG
jgi:hypothetical protein